jgi:hypothetical protein
LAESENVFDFRKGGKNNIKAQIGKGWDYPGNIFRSAGTVVWLDRILWY